MGIVSKSERAEIRLTINNYRFRRVADLRLWYIPKDKTEYVPSRKGITVDIDKLNDLAELLNKACEKN